MHLCARYESIKDPERLQQNFGVNAPDDLVTTDVWPSYKSIFIRRPKENDQTDETAPDREAIGPVFTEGTPRIGNNGVMVPTYLFKLVYDRHANRAWAHWQENK